MTKKARHTPRFFFFDSNFGAARTAQTAQYTSGTIIEAGTG
ncbi:hypothetical protein LMG27174_05655 [Paraburkholderia rhynchosiae]|uniref:Uncharacterized protein n=1 Tax=Paraburkholderia rhynchosiae TaxID=487049 RepID=A0A6J5CAA3_9BURK|nr:hypothetical protein LMG27174_05655 [Paraburkholderia rhynchosiae]